MTELVRRLNLTSTMALVIGSVIGTGVFMKAAPMAQLVGSPGLVLLAWMVAGLLSLAGALTIAELGAMLPKPGGEYVYIRAAFGDTLGYLCGWTRFSVTTAGIAALGAGFATFLSAIVPLNVVWAANTFSMLGREIQWQFGLREAVAVSLILLFGFVNSMGVAFGGRVQTLLTAAKVLGIGAIVLGAAFLSKSGTISNLSAHAASVSTGFQAFGAAVPAALWACDGWAFMPMAAGEVENPGRNVPRALIFGMLIVLSLYGLANLAYFYVLPFEEVATANSTRYRDALPVATKAAMNFLGQNGPAAVSFLFMISTAGALNGVILSLARVPFAMARDGLFFRKLGTISSSSLVPKSSLLAVSAWSAILALSGTFDQLTDLTIIGQWIFYGLLGTSVFVLRRKLPHVPRPYRVTGYPAVPAIFVLLAVALLLNSFSTNPVEVVACSVLILAGLPLFVYFRISARSAEVEGAAAP